MGEYPARAERDAAVSYRALLAVALLPPALAAAAPEDPRPSPLPGAYSLPPLPGRTRGPVALAFAPGGGRLWVAERDTDTVALLETRTGTLRRRFPAGGTGPAALAAVAGDLVLVASPGSGHVALLDGDSGAMRARAFLPGEPCALSVDPGGSRAWVALAQLDQVAELALPGLEVRGRVTVGRRPSALALTREGRLLVANSRGGDLSLVDTAALRGIRRLPTAGVNLRGLALTPDGRRALATGQIPANSRAAHEPLDIWTNTLFVAQLEPGARAPSAEGWLDFTAAPAPDPDGVAVVDDEHAAVTLGGSDEVLLVRARGPFTRTYDPVVVRRARVGARPRAVVLSPGGTELWVACELDSALWVLEQPGLRLLRRVPLAAPPGSADPLLPGRYLFGSALAARGGQFSCMSCHPAGATDGLAWEFVHVRDGLRLRNTRALRGGLAGTAPFRWSGHDPDLEGFIQEEITGLLGGPPLPAQLLRSLRRFVEELPLPPNPHRAPDGDHTAAGKRGAALFRGKAGCGSCHQGELYGGGGTRARVGTTPPGQLLDVPHLHGVFDTAPYLHDGRAATLAEVLTRHNSERTHGAAHLLSDDELTDLVQYLREL